MKIILEEIIICPACEHEQAAIVTAEDGDPWLTHVHWCEKCNYCIMESEWEAVSAQVSGE